MPMPMPTPTPTPTPPRHRPATAPAARRSQLHPRRRPTATTTPNTTPSTTTATTAEAASASASASASTSATTGTGTGTEQQGAAERGRGTSPNRALAAELDYSKAIPRSSGEDRPVPSVPLPETRELNSDMLFSDTDGKPNLHFLRTHLSKQGKLAIPAAIELLQTATQIFKQEPNLLELTAPITIIGDTHGQFYDVLQYERELKMGATTKVLWLGDYVDRGDFSSEIIFLLVSLKIRHPNSFWMLRGNHESEMMTSMMSFALECDRKYESASLYMQFLELFNSLPLAAVVTGCSQGTFFAVHGGISPQLQLVSEINAIDRFREPPHEGLMCDLLWSDPAPDPTTKGSPMELARFMRLEYAFNSERETSHVYGPLAVQKFLARNGFVSIIRAHQVVEQGYQEHKLFMGKTVPAVITIFSCPNYCNMYRNLGAVLQINLDGLKYRQFDTAPHPYCLPEFMDGASFAIPFLMEGLVDVLLSLVVSVKQEQQDKTASGTPDDPESTMREAVLINKMQKLREQIQKREAKAKALDSVNFSVFERVRQMDAANEKLPTKYRQRRKLFRSTSLHADGLLHDINDANNGSNNNSPSSTSTSTTTTTTTAPGSPDSSSS
ncbi:calcineurin catalytic subunit A [Pelomyxa schiedti]|nr:calcineurin catalytic subunit A [Pelomyxa schiedti]